MVFSSTCSKIKISSLAKLSVADPSNNSWFANRISLDLDTILGNDDGFFKLGEKSFSLTAKKIGLDSANSSILKAKLKRKDGTWNEDRIDLDQFLDVQDGQLRYTDL
jgi:hypothetical protein